MPTTPPPPDFGALMAEWRGKTTPSKMEEIAQMLGVSARSLEWLGVTWAADRGAMAFPMFDATDPYGDHPCGIRLRSPAGAKFAVTGSKSGIFIPYGALCRTDSARLFICEGPTDTAACLDMEIFALGRAACRGGEDIILSALRQLNPREVVIACDNDGPGIAGADILMEKINLPKMRFVPPGKDLRAFQKEGGNRVVLDSLLKNLLRF